MKKFFNIHLMMIMLAGVLVTSANAQTSSTQRVTASIPFTFSVGKTTLPAGRYTFTVLNPSSDRKVLQIRSLDGRSSAMTFTTGVIGSASDNAKLVFEHYGDHYVFARAQMAGDTTSLAVIRTKEPRDKHLAKAGKKSIVVTVRS